MLTKSQIAEIAERHGFEADDRVVIENAAQANSYHGKQEASPNWSTDYMGRIDAALLLDGYLQEMARCYHAEDAAARDFHRNAYGEG